MAGSVNTRSIAGGRNSTTRRAWRRLRPDAPGVAWPDLHLVGTRDQLNGKATLVMGQPLRDPYDPRWVLAVRTAEQLQAAILPPERRERLVRLGGMQGLSLFDSNLVIAIVQDQARRGMAPTDCPTAAEPQLRMVLLPRRASIVASLRGRRGLSIAVLVAGLLAIEVLLLAWFIS